MKKVHYFGSNSKNNPNAENREEKFEAANFDVSADKTLFSNIEYGRQAIGNGDIKNISQEQLLQVLNYGQYVIMSAEDNPDSKDWLKDYKMFLEEEIKYQPSEDFSKKIQVITDLITLINNPYTLLSKDILEACEPFRKEWNEISTHRLIKLLKLYGFRFTPITGNYGKEEKSFIIYTFVEGSQNIGALTLTETIQTVEAMGRFFKQDSILISRFGSNIYLYTYGPDKSKISYGELYNLVAPKQEYSSWLSALNAHGELIEEGFSLKLDFEQRKILQDFLHECDKHRDDKTKDFCVFRSSKPAAIHFQSILTKLADFRREILIHEVNQAITLCDNTRRSKGKSVDDYQDEIEISKITLPVEQQDILFPYLSELVSSLKSLVLEKGKSNYELITKKLNQEESFSCRDAVSLINSVINLIEREINHGELIFDEKRTAEKLIYPTNKQKIFILTRGIKDYAELGLALKEKFEEKGLSVRCISSDAHINIISEETPWLVFNNEVLDEMVLRNTRALQTCLSDPTVDVVIYCDMNRNLSYMEPHVRYAKEHGFECVAVQSNYKFNAATDPYYLQDHLKKTESKTDKVITFDTENNLSIPQITGTHCAKHAATLARKILHHKYPKTVNFSFFNTELQESLSVENSSKTHTP